MAEGLGVHVGADVYARARLVKEGTQPTHTLTSYYRPEHVEGTRIVGEPVVELHRTTYTADGTVVEFAVGIHAASRFAWEYEFKVPDSANDNDSDNGSDKEGSA